MSDSKFTSSNQSKSGNLIYKIGDAEAQTSTTTGNKSNQTAYVETINNINKDDVIKLYSSANRLVIFAIYATYTAKIPSSETLKSSSAVKVNDVALTLNAETNGYTISDNTITLSDNIKYLSMPNDIELVKTITFSSGDPEDEDVSVTFDGSIDGGYYIGTASIGLTGSVTNYTVKVKQNVTPTITLSGDAGSITLKSYEPTGSVKVTVSGANLTGATFTAPTVDGVTITPASATITDGAFSQEFTITTTATTASSTVIGFAHTGATTQNYTLTYSKTAMGTLSQTSVDGATTWDWGNAGTFAGELKASTSPTNAEYFLMANMPEITGTDASFNKQALQVMCQFPTRGSDHYFQGNAVKFTTTVPGKIDVDFSNTGGKRPYRYLRVNGTQTEFKSGNQDEVNATNIAVPAGEVVIDFYIPDASDPQSRDGDNVGTTMGRVYKIVFTPVASVSGTISAAGWSTFSSPYPLDLSKAVTNGTVYFASASDGSTVTLEEAPSQIVRAGEGLMVKGTAGETFTIQTAGDAGTGISGNLLKGQTVTGNVSATNHYVFGYVTETPSTYGFYALTAETEVQAGKAYLEYPAAMAPSFLRIVEGEQSATGVENIEANEKAMKFIENGQLYILRDGVVYDTVGRVTRK